MTQAESARFIESLLLDLGDITDVEVVIVPPFTAIVKVTEALGKAPLRSNTCLRTDLDVGALPSASVTFTIAVKGGTITDFDIGDIAEIEKQRLD